MSERGTVCGNCGTVNELGAQFCMNCGALLAAYVSALTPPPTVSDQERESEKTEATSASPAVQGPVSPSEATPADENGDVTQDQRAAIVPATDGVVPARAPEYPAPEPPAESAPPRNPEAISLPQPESPSQLSPMESRPHDQWPAPPSQAAPMRRPWPTPPSPATNHTDIPHQETTPPVSTPGPQPAPQPQPQSLNAWSQQQPPPPAWSTGAPSATPPPTPRASGTPPQTWIVLGSVLILISCVVGIAGSAVDLPFFFDAPAWCTFPIGVIILVIGLVQLATQRPRQ